MTAYLDNLTVEGLLAYGPLVTTPTSSTLTLNGTLTLVATSSCAQFFSGTQTGFSVVLPDATTLLAGWQYQFYNTSSQSITVKTNGGATLVVVPSATTCYISLQTATPAAGVWVTFQILTSGIAAGLVNYNVISATAFTTSSQTDVAITGFTTTPQSGTYAVFYNASVIYTATPKTHWWNIYKTGVKVADSERSQDTAHASQNMADSTMSIISVNGTDTLDIRVRCDTSGSLTVNQRSMLLQRLGP